jgi:branched-subunit amino acid ABC-type transport system permease component
VLARRHFLVTQILANSIVYASEIAIIAVGVALSYSILRFANFAHVQFAVVGGYLTYVFAVLAGLPIVVATAIGAVLTGGLAVAIDAVVFRRLRTISPEGKMIVSWGVALFIRSIVAAIFGGASRNFPTDAASLNLAGAQVTSLDIVVVAATILAMVVLHVLLYRTRIGTALRALASNPDLAETRGIPGERMIGLMWFVSGACAALGGTLFAIETRLQPGMDLIILLPTFAAVTIGGLDNVFGAVAGALVLSLAQNLLISIDFGGLVADTSWYVPTQFRDYIAVGALVVILLLRPRRVAGRATR